MPAPHKDLRELARKAYFALPVTERSAENVRAAMKKTGIDNPPSKGSIIRWTRDDWSKVVEQTAAIFLPELTAKASAKFAVAPAPPIDKRVPASLRDLLPAELLYFAQGENDLERISSAAGDLAEAIGRNATQIAEMLLDTESETIETTTGADGSGSKKTIEKGTVARNAVSSIGELARAMQTIMTSRSVVSLSARNISQADLLAAQAQATIESGRPDRAKTIGGGHTVIDAKAEEKKNMAREAIETLRASVGK